MKIMKKSIYLQLKRTNIRHTTRYMQYGGFSAKKTLFAQWNFVIIEYLLLKAATSHIPIRWFNKMMFPYSQVILRSGFKNKPKYFIWTVLSHQYIELKFKKKNHKLKKKYNLKKICLSLPSKIGCFWDSMIQKH